MKLFRRDKVKSVKENNNNTNINMNGSANGPHSGRPTISLNDTSSKPHEHMKIRTCYSLSLNNMDYNKEIER
jgi:hypothetical protein